MCDGFKFAVFGIRGMLRLVDMVKSPGIYISISLKSKSSQESIRLLLAFKLIPRPAVLLVSMDSMEEGRGNLP